MPRDVGPGSGRADRRRAGGCIGSWPRGTRNSRRGVKGCPTGPHTAQSGSATSRVGPSRRSTATCHPSGGVVDHPARPDMTSLPDLLHVRATAGPVRDRRPVYVDLLPPCNAGCPAGENIQAWLAHAEAGRHEQAWRQLTEDNPLPAIHGRVCYHPLRGGLQPGQPGQRGLDPLGRAVPRRPGARPRLVVRPPRGRRKRVLVVGAGPSGLSAAYHLARLGHEVEIADAGDVPGGMMRYGIPAYRLPRDVLDAEIARIEALGLSSPAEGRLPAPGSPCWPAGSAPRWPPPPASRTRPTWSGTCWPAPTW